MVFPAKPLDFIVPGDPPLDPDWINHFGAFRWCRLRGWTEEFADLKRDVASAHKASCDGIGKFTIHAIDHVPQELQDLLPTGTWKVFATPQIRSCDAGSPLGFDKACQVAAAFDLYANHYNRGTNYLRRMRITPAIFELKGFDGDLWERIQTQKLDGPLRKHTAQLYPLFFRELSYGYSATYHTLESIIDFLKQHKMAAGLSIMQMPTRAYPGKVHPPIVKEKAGKPLEKRPAAKETVAAHP